MAVMIRPALLFFFLFIQAGFVDAEDVTLDSIDQLRWSSRVILVKIDDDDHQTLTLLENAEQEINERHINWFVFTRNTFYSNFKNRIGRDFRSQTLSQYLGADDRVVLLGKDGYVKLKSATLELEKIFALIDSMPMRQMEMTSQSE